ncbi:MAG: hypothetical protein ACXWNX_09255 [Isosphaeraceae bacterium]
MLHAGEDIANQRVALFIACLSAHDVLACLSKKLGELNDLPEEKANGMPQSKRNAS